MAWVTENVIMEDRRLKPRKELRKVHGHRRMWRARVMSTIWVAQGKRGLGWVVSEPWKAHGHSRTR